MPHLYVSINVSVIIIIIDNFCVALFSGVPRLTAFLIMIRYLTHSVPCVCKETDHVFLSLFFLFIFMSLSLATSYDSCDCCFPDCPEAKMKMKNDSATMNAIEHLWKMKLPGVSVAH